MDQRDLETYTGRLDDVGRAFNEMTDALSKANRILGDRSAVWRLYGFIPREFEEGVRIAHADLRESVEKYVNLINHKVKEQSNGNPKPAGLGSFK